MGLDFQEEIQNPRGTSLPKKVRDLKIYKSFIFSKIREDLKRNFHDSIIIFDPTGTGGNAAELAENIFEDLEEHTVLKRGSERILQECLMASTYASLL